MDEKKKLLKDMKIQYVSSYNEKEYAVEINRVNQMTESYLTCSDFYGDYLGIDLITGEITMEQLEDGIPQPYTAGTTTVESLNMIKETLFDVEVRKSFDMEQELMEKQEQKSEHTRLFVDMDGTLARYQPVETMELLFEQGYFLNLEPQQNVVDAIKKIIQNHPEKQVYIMSSVLSDSKYALQEKNEWLDKYLPEIDRRHRIFPPCGKDKQNYVPSISRSSDCLLDDYTHNLNQWETRAQGIKLLNGINNTHESWNGNMLRYDKTPDELAQNIIDIMEQKELIQDERPDPQKVSAANQTYDQKVKLGYISEEQESKLEYLTRNQALTALKEGIHICSVNDYREYHGSHADEYGIKEIRKEQGVRNLYSTYGRGIIHKACISPYYDNPGELKKLLKDKTVPTAKEKEGQILPISPSM